MLCHMLFVCISCVRLWFCYSHHFCFLQDIMVRYNRMRGRPTLWLPGTDHAGIATQVHFPFLKFEMFMLFILVFACCFLLTLLYLFFPLHCSRSYTKYQSPTFSLLKSFVVDMFCTVCICVVW